MKLGRTTILWAKLNEAPIRPISAFAFHGGRLLVPSRRIVALPTKRIEIDLVQDHRARARVQRKSPPSEQML
jgi:hypothetical protein